MSLGSFRFTCPTLAILLVLLRATQATSELVVSWSNKSVVAASPVFPQYRDFGVQRFGKNNVSSQELYLFERKHVLDLCSALMNHTLMAQLRKIYQGQIILISPGLDARCDREYSHLFSYLDDLCSLHATVISVDSTAAIFANSRPFDGFKGLRYHKNCSMLVTPTDFDESILEFLRFSLVPVSATLVLDRNEFLDHFESFWFQFFYKYTCGAGYLSVVAYGLFIFLCRALNRSLSMLFCVILSVNLLSGTFLGLLQLLGSHFTDNKLPYSVAFFGYLTFFGSSAATNALMLVKYEQLITAIPVTSQAALKIASRWKYWLLSMFLLVLDVSLAALLSLSNRKSTTVLILLVTEVGVFYVAQGVVLYRMVTLSQRVLNILKKRSLRGIVPVLRVRFRFWMAISVAASVLNVAAYSIGVLIRLLLSTKPTLFKYNVFVFGLTVGKIVHLLAQFKLCAPVKAALVSPTTVSSGGYMSFFKG